MFLDELLWETLEGTLGDHDGENTIGGDHDVKNALGGDQDGENTLGGDHDDGGDGSGYLTREALQKDRNLVAEIRRREAEDLALYSCARPSLTQPLTYTPFPWHPRPPLCIHTSLTFGEGFDASLVHASLCAACYDAAFSYSHDFPLPARPQVCPQAVATGVARGAAGSDDDFVTPARELLAARSHATRRYTSCR